MGRIVGYAIAVLALLAVGYGIAASIVGNSSHAPPAPSAPSVDASPPPILSFGTDAKSQTVVFDASNTRGRSGVLTLLLRASGDQQGRLKAHLLSTSTGSKIAVGREPTTAYTSDRPAIWLVHGSSLSLASNELKLLRLQFGLSFDAKPTAADGVLRITLRVPARKPHTKKSDPLELDVPVIGSLPKLSLQPKDVSLGVTRLLGPLSSLFSLCRTRCDAGDRARIRLRGDNVYAYNQGYKEGGGAILRSDTAGTADVDLRPGEAPAQKAQTADVVIEAKDISRAGKYTGDVPLGPAAGGENSALPVTVNAQDFFLWPLLVLSIGALIGGLGVQSYELRRRREVLKSALKRAERRLRDEPPPQGLYDPAPELFGGRTAERFPAASACPADNQPQTPTFIAAWCATLRASSDEDFEAATAQVNRVVADINRWLELRASYVELDDALTDFGDTPIPDAAADARALQLQVQRPVPADEIDSWRGRAAGQVRVFPALTDVYLAWSGDPNRANENPAATIYAKYRQPRTPEATTNLLQDLATELDRLRTPRVDELESWTTKVMAFADMPATERTHVLTSGVRLSASPAWLGKTVEEADHRSPEQIVAGLRRWDWTIGLVTALVTAVAVLIPFYAGKNFGAWNDYLLAFTAGFLGQAVGGIGALTFNWKNLPPFRSYGIRPAVAADSDGGTNTRGT